MSDLNSPQIDQERLAKWRENTLPVELPEGFKKPMGLEWRTDSEPVTRTWVNVPEGQLIAELGLDGAWRFAWMLIDSIECRASARAKFQYRNFPTMDSIRREVEHWYTSTQARNADQCKPSS